MVTDDKDDLPAPWQWPGLWSVNLPVVVTLWMVLFTQSFHVWLSVYQVFTAGALAWTFLAAERWIYFFRLRTDLAETILGEKLADQRVSILRISLLLVAGLIMLAFLRASTREVAGMLIWSSAGGIYLLALRLYPEEAGEFLPREMALAGYLAGIAVLFTWANGAFPLMRLLLPALLFLLLLFYYFCVVSSWAKPLLPKLSTGALLESSLGAVYRGVPLLLILSAAALVLVSREMGTDSLLLTIGVSGLILLLLDFQQQHLSKPAARALADVALLAPVVPLLIERLG